MEVVPHVKGLEICHAAPEVLSAIQPKDSMNIKMLDVPEAKPGLLTEDVACR